MSIQQKLREKIKEMQDSSDSDQRIIGDALDFYVGGARDEDIPGILRSTLRGLKEALDNFDDFWLKENGE